ncbi:hypothetical protein Tco_1484615 [Tanacetum coccineum]
MIDFRIHALAKTSNKIVFLSRLLIVAEIPNMRKDVEAQQDCEEEEKNLCYEVKRSLIGFVKSNSISNSVRTITALSKLHHLRFCNKHVDFRKVQLQALSQ